MFERGTVEDPAVVKASIHPFFKIVAGSPLVRPPWFFDTAQQGEGIVDVTTHLVDLVQWECFPGETIDGASDIVLEKARRSTTPIAKDQFRKATGGAAFRGATSPRPSTTPNSTATSVTSWP